MNKAMKYRFALTAFALAISMLTFSSASLAAPLPLAMDVTNAAPIKDESITVSGSLPDEVVRPIKLERLNGDGTTWDDVPLTPAVNTAATGAFSFPYTVANAQKIRVRAPEATINTTTYQERITDSRDLTITPNTGVLADFTPDAKTTVTFAPVRAGQATELQKQTIPTIETNEVNGEPKAGLANPDPTKAGDFVGTWVKVASGTQDASGKTTFALTSPLEAEHNYRAVTKGTTGPTTTSNVVKFANPVATKPDTGLSKVFFNTNEGHPVDTRTRYFEGEFSMTASSKIPACVAQGLNKNSVMKGRGNYSWSFSKKSFTLKLGAKKNLCGMGSSKKWALVANAYDKSLLRNAVAHNIGSKLTNMAWTPKMTPVDLYMNGSYRGSYSLVERITIQKPEKLTDADPNKRVTARVSIDELKAGDGAKVDGVVVPIGQAANPTHPNNLDPKVTGGYIMEWDFRKGGDKNISVGSRGYVGLKDPEFDLNRDGAKTNAGVSPQQVTYIDRYLDAADKALFASNFKDPAAGWRKYIDEASAVDYYIGMEMMKPVDGNMWASVYMFKPRLVPGGTNPQDDGKLRFGPMWDFDLAAGSANRGGNTVGSSGWYLRNKISTTAKQSSTTWFNRLNEDSTFRAAVKARWNVVYASLDQNQFIDSQKTLLTDSANENFRKWNVKERMSTVQVIKGSWSAEVSYLKSWVNSRRTWMNGQYK